MTMVTIEEAAHRLSDMIKKSREGEEIILTEDDRPVARLVAMSEKRPRPRRGSGKDFIAYMADDFDATPDGFGEYMP